MLFKLLPFLKQMLTKDLEELEGQDQDIVIDYIVLISFVNSFSKTIFLKFKGLIYATLFYF